MGTTDEPFDQLQLQLAILARRSEHVRTAALDVARSPLDRSGYLLLALLEKRGDQTMSQLAAAFNLDASTVTRQIAPLERRGFVARERSTEDRRATIVSVTDAGRRERALVRRARIEHLSKRLADWAPGDVAQLAALIEQFNATLGPPPEDPAPAPEPAAPAA